MLPLHRELSKSSLLSRVIAPCPWLLKMHTRTSNSLMDSGRTLSGFPSSNENCKSFSFVLLSNSQLIDRLMLKKKNKEKFEAVSLGCPRTATHAEHTLPLPF